MTEDEIRTWRARCREYFRPPEDAKASRSRRRDRGVQESKSGESLWTARAGTDPRRRVIHNHDFFVEVFEGLNVKDQTDPPAVAAVLAWSILEQQFASDSNNKAEISPQMIEAVVQALNTALPDEPLAWHRCDEIVVALALGWRPPPMPYEAEVPGRIWRIWAEQALAKFIADQVNFCTVGLNFRVIGFSKWLAAKENIARKWTQYLLDRFIRRSQPTSQTRIVCKCWESVKGVNDAELRGNAKKAFRACSANHQLPKFDPALLLNDPVAKNREAVARLRQKLEAIKAQLAVLKRNLSPEFLSVRTESEQAKLTKNLKAQLSKCEVAKQELENNLPAAEAAGSDRESIEKKLLILSESIFDLEQKLTSQQLRQRSPEEQHQQRGDLLAERNRLLETQSKIGKELRRLKTRIQADKKPTAVRQRQQKHEQVFETEDHATVNHWTLWRFIERAVKGFVGDSFDKRFFPNGMLFYFCSRDAKLDMSSLARWFCESPLPYNACNAWKSARCSERRFAKKLGLRVCHFNNDPAKAICRLQEGWLFIRGSNSFRPAKFYQCLSEICTSRYRQITGSALPSDHRDKSKRAERKTTAKGKQSPGNFYLKPNDPAQAPTCPLCKKTLRESGKKVNRTFDGLIYTGACGSDIDDYWGGFNGPEDPTAPPEGPTQAAIAEDPFAPGFMTNGPQAVRVRFFSSLAEEFASWREQSWITVLCEIHAQCDASLSSQQIEERLRQCSDFPQRPVVATSIVRELARALYHVCAALSPWGEDSTLLESIWAEDVLPHLKELAAAIVYQISEDNV